MGTARILEPAHTNRLALQILEQYLVDKDYEHQKTLEWSQDLANQILDKINTSYASTGGLHRYKYVVNCSIQKHGSGLQTSSACLWDSATDVATCVKYQQKNIDCTVHIYAIAFD